MVQTRVVPTKFATQIVFNHRLRDHMFKHAEILTFNSFLFTQNRPFALLVEALSKVLFGRDVLDMMSGIQHGAVVCCVLDTNLR